MSDYDLVIIGAGPAGLTAGLYAARARMKVLLLEKAVPGGQIIITDWIENYPGFPEGISGYELCNKLTEQAKTFDLPIESNEVVSMDLSGAVKKLTLSDRTITAHSIILCPGASPRRLGVPGEDKFYGKGVSFCGTCDAPFYKDKVVAAVGGGDTAVQEAVYLTRFVEKVYLIHRRDEFRAAKILQERLFRNDKIEVVWDSRVTAIEGFFNLEKVAVENVKTGEKKDLAVDGCFVWVGITPNTEFLGDALETDDMGFIIANEEMETSIPGVFVAGDARRTPLRQIVTATSDGAVAAYSAEHYLTDLKSRMPEYAGAELN
jgi:thioredoxin reductase (NADPH)